MQDAVTESTGSEVVEDLMTKYTEFSIAAQLPHTVDGLTKVHRRILSVVGSDKENIIHKLEGWSGPIGERHPHGGGSITETMSKMMQVFRYHHPFFNTHGQSGTYIVPSPAAPRYLRASLSPFARDVYFDTHTSAITYVPRESGGGTEEAFLIPKIPMALLLATTGIATGYSVDTYPRLLANICDLAIWYCEQYSKGTHTAVWSNIFPPEVLPLLIPNYPIRQIILNYKELLQEYSRGNFTYPVLLEGGIKVKDNSIVVMSFPHHTDYGTQVTKLRNLRRSKQLPEFTSAIASVHDGKSKHEPNREGWLTIQFKNRVNPYDHLETVKKVLGVKSTHRANPQYLTKYGKNKITGPGELLSTWFEERHNATYTKIQKRIEALYRTLRELEAKIIIKDNLDRVIEICKDLSDQDSHPVLKREFGLSTFQCGVVTSISLSGIGKASRDHIVSELNRVNEEIPVQKYKLERLVEDMIEGIQKIKKKYADPYVSPTIIPTYIGMVRHGQDTRFLCSTDTPPTKSTTMVLPKVFRYIYVLDGLGRWVSNELIQHSKYGQYQAVQHTPHPCKYTVVLSDGKIYYNNGLVNHPDGTLVSNRYTYINKRGEVGLGTISELPLRKGKDSQGNITDIVHVSAVASAQRLVLYTNPKEPCTVRVSVVTGDTKLKSLVGKRTQYTVLPLLTNLKSVIVPLDPVVMKGLGGYTSVDLGKMKLDLSKPHQIVKITKNMVV